MITQIGIASGEILNLIDEKKRPVSIGEIESHLDSEKELAYMSIGWLVREGHVTLVDNGEKMSKHSHLQSMTEQIGSKGHASAPFHYRKSSYRVNRTMDSGDIQADAAIDNNSIQLRAYQIYQEKGGSDLENWLEAERILKNV